MEVTVKAHNEGVVICDAPQDCTLTFTDPPAVNEETTEKIIATVTKTVYSRDGNPKMLLLSAERSADEVSSDVNTVSSSPTNSVSQHTSNQKQTSSPSSSSTQPDTVSATDSSENLDEIAEELIGDEELEVTEDEDSVISTAKKRARKQNRDPAIDPDFQ